MAQRLEVNYTGFSVSKVQIFWEGLKNWKKSHNCFDIAYVINIERSFKICSAFLERLNFRRGLFEQEN